MATSITGVKGLATMAHPISLRVLGPPIAGLVQALHAARERQQTDEFKEEYRARAGVEGVISQATVALGMRRTRYRGQDKTHLQNAATGSAINLLRAVNWLMGKPKSETHVSASATLAA
jgi:hypothetical protein